MFFDDPKSVPAAELRWWIGWTVPSGFYFISLFFPTLPLSLFFSFFQLTCPQLDKVNQIKSKELHIHHQPRSRSLVAKFPYHNMISPLIGAFRVYPTLNEVFLFMCLLFQFSSSFYEMRITFSCEKFSSVTPKILILVFR